MSRKNVLVVEDDDTIRRLLIDYLEEHTPLHADGARDGVDALHMIRSASYEAVVLDVIMPKMTGIDFLDSLRTLSADRSFGDGHHTPGVIVITSSAEEDVPTEGLSNRFGFVRAVFRKPLDITAVAAEVERACGVGRS